MHQQKLNIDPKKDPKYRHIVFEHLFFFLLLHIGEKVIKNSRCHRRLYTQEITNEQKYG